MVGIELLGQLKKQQQYNCGNRMFRRNGFLVVAWWQIWSDVHSLSGEVRGRSPICCSPYIGLTTPPTQSRNNILFKYPTTTYIACHFEMSWFPDFFRLSTPCFQPLQDSDIWRQMTAGEESQCCLFPGNGWSLLRVKNLQIWPRKRGFEKRVFLLLVEIVSWSFGDSYENHSDHFACSQNFVMVFDPPPSK